jgi:hypothetical protein
LALPGHHHADWSMEEFHLLDEVDFFGANWERE